MRKISTFAFVALGAAMASTNAFAVGGIPQAPEISAVGAVAALAVVGAAVALVRERSK